MPSIIKRTDITDAPTLVMEEPQIVLPEAKPLEEELPVEQDVPEMIDLEIIRLQAENIIRNAQSESENLRIQMMLDMENLKTQTHDEAYQAGHEQGLQAGVEEAHTQMQEALKESTNKAHNLIMQAEQQVKEIVLGAERQIIELTIAICRKILAREIEENPMVILPIVREALDKIRDQEQIKIHVNPEEYDLVLQARRDLQIIVGHEQTIQIIPDISVTSGGCIIDTAYGSVDARIDTQLDTLRQALEEALP